MAKIMFRALRDTTKAALANAMLCWAGTKKRFHVKKTAPFQTPA
jgi:hypothetical protein